jgi:Family of unknown function (DUF6011)
MTTIAPITFLAELREAVLTRSHSRMPKWRFRLAPDLVLQIQPKPTMLLSALALELGSRQRLVQFDGRAVMAEAANAAMLEREPQQDAPWWIKRFQLHSYAADEWILADSGGRWKRNAGIDGYKLLENRLIEALRGGFFDRLSADKLLLPQCLICGKQLTDPASMARWIGPECAGASSLRVPFTIKPGGEYKPRDDFSRSVEECYRAVRERVAAGGVPWVPK